MNVTHHHKGVTRPEHFAFAFVFGSGLVSECPLKEVRNGALRDE